ncbi:MAG: hypothetical protein GC137_08615 [Alphaproteobacteria bacterium]|nr:hypothetical protein [Alphaproteobacteria bacterium]
MKIRSLFLASTLLTGCVSVDYDYNSINPDNASSVEAKNQAEAIRPPAPVQFVDNANVFCSDKTRAYFGDGLMSGFQILAGANGLQTLLIVSHDDVFEGDAHNIMELDEYRNLIQEYASRLVLENPNVPENLIKTGLLAASRFGRRLGAICFDEDINGDGNADVAVVFIPSRAETKEEWLNSHCRPVDEELYLLPGTDKDWHVMTVAHEIGHASIKKDVYGFFHSSEIEADQNAVDFMIYASNLGLVTDPNVGTAFVRIRALKTVDRMFGVKDGGDWFAHDTSAGVKTLDEMTVPITEDDQPYKDALSFLESKVVFHVGSKYFQKKKAFTNSFNVSILHNKNSPWTKIGSELELLANSGRRAFAEQVSLSLVFMVMGRSSAQDVLHQIQALEEHHALGSNKFSETFRQGVEYIGMFVNLSKPEKFKFLRDLYLDGVFDENDIAKQFVYEYLRAAMDYAPVTFKVEDPCEVLEPPLFPNMRAVNPSNRQDKTQEVLFGELGV